MMSGYNGDGVSSLPTRTQSPLARGAHPGAVLLSPKRTALGTLGGGAGGSSAQLMSPSQHSLSLNDILDQQAHPSRVDSSSAMSLDASIHQQQHTSGVGMLSPLLQPQASSISVKTAFLDSFGSRPSSAIGLQHGQGQGPDGPQSATGMSLNNSNIMVNFTNDVNQLCTWMSMLTSAQQNTVMDNLLSSLNEEVLQHTKLKLESLTNSGYLSPSLRPIASPIPSRVATLETSTQSASSAQLPGSLMLDSILSDSAAAGAGSTNSNNTNMASHSLAVNSMYRQWSPSPQMNSAQPMFDYLNDITRPRSAEPSRLRNGHTSHHQNGSHHIAMNSGNGAPPNSHSSTGHQVSSQAGGRFSNIKPQRPHSPTSLTKSTSSSSNFSEAQSPAAQPTSPGPSTPNAASNVSSSSNMNPKSLCDPKLLKNIPAWLKSLRLHKYSASLNGKSWQELIDLDDAILEDMGVSALGARRKLLKAFAIVKECKERGLVDESAY